jgi:hypothetical protein
MVTDEFVVEELRWRATLEKMDEAFCTAMLKAIDAGEECPPIAICTEPGTRNPIIAPAY